ncbi:hypothetical protein [Mycobacterium sp. 236(2023)]|uniref:hypothetical protein n=1 Tax=Mycobacterium sp. 236(2023) TaxID=3038163 RepID=UPI00241528ED|nr:hypothetical protein [Mycobacterium sp. 236(2023)]MDG4668630.1 hypothetical protein [Mycobacterium sp. 236(2023)]
MGPTEWQAVVELLPPHGQSAIVQLTAAPLAAGWLPTPEDIAVLREVADGLQPLDVLLTRLADADDDIPPPAVAGNAGAVASAVAGTRARWLLSQARDARVVLERIRRIPVAGADSQWLKRIARQTLDQAGPDGKSGALGQFRGHFFEQIDVRAYNLKNLPMRRVLQLRGKAHAPGYDASRFINRRFAGGIQHKLSASGVVKAADKLNARKAGSATRATLRLPKDQARRATTRVAGRMRVEASEISTAAIKRRGNAGLRQLSRSGKWAVSPTRQFTQKAGVSALTGMAMGAASDASRLYRKEMGSHEFASRRGLDAVEQSASYAAGIAATAGVVTGLKSVAAGGGVLAGTAATAAGSGVVLPLAVAAVAGSAVVYSLRPIRRRAEAWAVERSKRKRMNSEAAAAPVVEASDPKE